MIKKGDTLIEVVIAIGIFSLIAVSVVSVVGSSSSGAQTAVESTLAREEIDAQAEALRFIQAGYIEAYGDSEADITTNPYVVLWREITKNALDEVPSYTPDTCAELYSAGEDGNIPVVSQHAFVINTNGLNGYLVKKNKSLNDIYITATNDSSSKLAQSSTYPRLVFVKNGETSDEESLSDANFYDELYRSEGLYVVAVKSEKKPTSFAAAYYDFYIRSCWYGVGDREPSTISTVIRLSDPALVSL